MRPEDFQIMRVPAYDPLTKAIQEGIREWCETGKLPNGEKWDGIKFKESETGETGETGCSNLSLKNNFPMRTENTPIRRPNCPKNYQIDNKKVGQIEAKEDVG